MESESDSLLLKFINVTIEKGSNEAEQFLLYNFSEPYKAQLRKLIQVMNELRSYKKQFESFRQIRAKYNQQIDELKRQLYGLRSQQFKEKMNKQKKRYQILLYLQKGDLQGAISKSKEIKSKQLQMLAQQLHHYDNFRKVALQRLNIDIENILEFTKVIKLVKSNSDYTLSTNDKLIQFYQSAFCQEIQCDLPAPYFSSRCKEKLIQLKNYLKNYRIITQQQETLNRETLISLCHKKGIFIKNTFVSFSSMFKKISMFLEDRIAVTQSITLQQNLSATAPQKNHTSIQQQNANKMEGSIANFCQQCQILKKALEKSDEVAKRETAYRESLTKQIKKIEKASFINENDHIVQQFQSRESQKSIKVQDSKWRQKYNNSTKSIKQLQNKILQLQKIISENINKKSIYEENGEQERQKIQEYNYNQNEETTIRFHRQFAMAGDLIAELQNKTDGKVKKTVKLLQKTILALQKLNSLRDEQFQTEKISLKIENGRIFQQNRDINEENDRLKEHIQQFPQNPFCFPIGLIFKQEDMDERNFLLKILTLNVGVVKETRLIYRADVLSNVNFHRYIDGHPHIVFIGKTITGRLIAGYSAEAFVSGATNKGYGLLLSLSNQKYFVIKVKRAITYDDFFMIFGNSELRLKTQEFKLFSNFGIPSGYFDSKGEKVHAILGMDKQREIDLVEYEFYQLILG